MKSPIAEKLLRWYSKRRRSLPWREHPRPYAVWVAEIMAQQTRLETMLPYYKRWLRRFPSIKELARSNDHDVLKVWEGLGYYRRALNLRRAAKIVMAKHAGRLPREIGALQTLPGIGPYTAGAIASLAFGRDEPAVDGNGVRVLARLFNVRLPLGSSRATNRFWKLAADHLPAGHAAEYNQALMDLGATLCKSKRPDCPVCPLRAECGAYALGVQERLPARPGGNRSPVRYFAIAIIQRRGQVLLVRRPDEGLLARMWSFPWITLNAQSRPKHKMRKFLRESSGGNGGKSINEFGKYEHAFSHFTARVTAFRIDLNGANIEVKVPGAQRWVGILRIGGLPMGKLDRQIALALRDNGNRAKR